MEGREGAVRNSRVGRDEGIVGDQVSPWHFVEHPLGVFEGSTFGIDREEIVAEEWRGID